MSFRCRVFLIGIACVVATGVFCAGAEPASFHVAIDGKDSADGSLATPFATPARAAQAVRASGKPATVILHSGTYWLPEPLCLTSADSATTWVANGNDRVVLSGGVRITGWREGDLNGRKIWVAKSPTKEFRSLWVNGERRLRARHPNSGTLSVPEAPEPNANWDQGQLHFAYTAGDVPAFTTDDAEVLAFTRWVESRLPVLRHDPAHRELDFTRRSIFMTQAGDVYWIENAAEFLDQPGEWFSRRKTGEVFYLPKPGEKIESFEAVVPQLTSVVRIEGRPEAGKFVDQVSFRGITFAHAEWSLPAAGIDQDGHPTRGGFEQAAYGVPGAVWAEGARHCSFENCTFVNIGDYGLELARGCQDNHVIRCNFTDLGAGGIKLGEKAVRDREAEHACRNEVSDCSISNYGKLFADAVGVLIGQSYDNRVSHCLIRDGFYTGISIGWTWGYDNTPTHGNVIEHNHIHHIGIQSSGEASLISDMGGVYTLGIQPGTVIRDNYIHDIDGRVYGGWGVYLDEGSSNIVVERNLIHTTTHGGFHQHYGKDNIVRNNILAFGRTRQIERSKAEDHRSFTFEHNIVIWDQGQGIMGDWSNFNATFRANQYWPYGKAEPLFAYVGFDQWRAKGMDEGSVIADPRFVDAAHGDFRFKPGMGPAKSVGFEPLNLSDVGPRPASN